MSDDPEHLDVTVSEHADNFTIKFKGVDDDGDEREMVRTLANPVTREGLEALLNDVHCEAWGLGYRDN